MRKQLAVLLIFLICLPSQAFSWGATGHSIIAEVAYRHVRKETRDAVASLLGAVSLASISSWADDYKFSQDGANTYNWHFISTDISQPKYADVNCTLDDRPATADRPALTGCLVSALQEQFLILADKTIPDEKRKLALKLLVHLVGDSTQPFHCGSKNKDAGGNSILVLPQFLSADGKMIAAMPTKLHAAWDEDLVNAHQYSWGTYADEIDKLLPSMQALAPFDNDFAKTWIDQCHAMTIQLYSMIPKLKSTTGFIVLDSNYQAAVQPIVSEQLAIGSMRLVLLLDRALGN